MKADSNRLAIVICLLILLETLCATYLLRLPRFSAIVSIIYFLTGVGIATFLIFHRPVKFYSKEKSRSYFPYIMFFFIIAAAVYACYYTDYWIRSTPMSYEYADMLPVIKVMNERVLAGQVHQVYDRIPDIWGGAQPVYYPAMWLPYIAGVILNIDLRWENSFALFASITVCILMARKVKAFLPAVLFIFTAILLITWLYSEPVHNYIRLTEEGVVVLYYLLFGLALISGRPLLIGISLGFCLLSRFSMIGWIPATGLYLLWEKKYRQLALIASGCLLVVLFLFIIPFGPGTAIKVLKLSGMYLKTAPNVWQVNPEYFTNFLGFARFFVPGHFRLLNYCLVGASFLLPIGFVLFFKWIQKKTEVHNLMLATAKLSIVVFYSFIYVPYLYLFYTSSVFSLLIASMLIREFHGGRKMDSRGPGKRRFSL